jgi:hypothetical protein
VRDASRGGGRAKHPVDVLEKRAHSWRRHLNADENPACSGIPRACRARWERSLVKKSCSWAANLSRALSGKPAPISAWARIPPRLPQMKRRARGLIDDCSGLCKHGRRLPHGCRRGCIDRGERLVEPERVRGGGPRRARCAHPVARATPGRCGIILHNRVPGRIEALDGGKSRTKEVPRGKFPA